MWRATALPVKIWVLDARACLPALIFVVYWSWLTLKIALLGMAFFATISFLGLTLPAMLRQLRRWVIGPVRPATPAAQQRRLA